ncbi:hypothetical protein ACGF8A_32460, partial [Streptomyces sp. NPDC047706]
PTLVDLGYENAGDGFRHPHKKPAGGELTEEQASSGTPSSSVSCTATFPSRPATAKARVVLPEQLDPVSMNSMASGCRRAFF